MDHAPLNLGLWVDCLDRFLKAGKPVHTEKEDILYTTVFQVVGGCKNFCVYGN